MPPAPESDGVIGTQDVIKGIQIIYLLLESQKSILIVWVNMLLPG
jgi:hypothetical protein